MTRSELAALLGAPAEIVAEPRTGPSVITEPDPRKFMNALASAVAGREEVFLCDPNWGENEKSQVARLSALSSPPSAQPSQGWLLIPTGGTSGTVKFARHDEETLSAAVSGFSTHFGLQTVNAAGVLPLHHVSGLMAWLRCALTGGEFRPLDWKAVEGGELPALPAKATGWTLSLVPTQLERLLNQKWAVAWLKGFRIIFLGGAPAWPALLDRAAGFGLPISLGYGMTETAAMVTALRPAEFLAGVRSNGPALPHATVRIGDDERIIISGRSLFRGYYPDRTIPGGEFATQDRGHMDGQGHLHVLGRLDAVIITGGEKVDPGELETLLRQTGQFTEVVVLGLPDARWGQRVVAVYPGNSHPNFHEVIRATNRLADYKRPKSFIPLVGPWPASAQGKINRAELTARVAAQVKERR
jgi:O-succinylbenzoic acid--CoA ligase